MGCVLLVDDSPLQLKVRETVLHNAGFTVCVATSADSALAMLRGLAESISLVITDHLMPEGDGVRLTRTLRQENPWVPVIVLSGMPEAEPEYAGLDVVFRVKPVPPPELIELVRSCLENKGNDQAGAA